MPDDPAPPWARPLPATDPAPEHDRRDPPGAPQPAVPDAPDPAPRAPSAGDQPLFPDQDTSGEAHLFPGAAARRRVREELPAVPRTGRRVGPASDVPPGGTGRPPPPGPGPAGPGPAAPGPGPAAPDPASGTASPPPGRRPPPVERPAPDNGPDTGPDPGPAAADAGGDQERNVGVVAGPVTTTSARHRFWGFEVLACAAAIAAVAIVGRALAGGLSGPALAVGVLGPALSVALLGGVRWWVAGRARTGRATATGTPPETVQVRRFRMQPVTGDARSYLIEGELPDDVPQTGDIVRVHGRRVRDGHVVAREVEILATLEGPVVRSMVGRPGPAYVAARWVSRLGLGLAAAVLLGAASVISGLTV